MANVTPSKTGSVFPHHVPAIPMVKLLRQYAASRKLPFNGRWETITRLYHHYNETAKLLN